MNTFLQSIYNITFKADKFISAFDYFKYNTLNDINYINYEIKQLSNQTNNQTKKYSYTHKLSEIGTIITHIDYSLSRFSKGLTNLVEIWSEPTPTNIQQFTKPKYTYSNNFKVKENEQNNINTTLQNQIYLDNLLSGKLEWSWNKRSELLQNYLAQTFNNKERLNNLQTEQEFENTLNYISKKINSNKYLQKKHRELYSSLDYSLKSMLLKYHQS
jgi:hypothetical protein